MTAPLRHDIGKQLLVRIVDDATFTRLQQIRTMPRADRIQAAHELLGCDHAELGEWIAQKWRLPDEIRLPIRHHHDPMQFGNRSVDAVYLANVVAQAIGEALSKAPADPELLDAMLRRLEVSLAGLSRLGVLTHQKLEQVLRRYD
jgi:HD-like signal output (HDOD) protein